MGVIREAIQSNGLGKIGHTLKITAKESVLSKFSIMKTKIPESLDKNSNILNL